MKNTLIVDAHLDLSMNALEWNRDLRWSIEQIRASEAGMQDKPDRGNGTVSFEALRKGNFHVLDWGAETGWWSINIVKLLLDLIRL